MLFHLSQTTKKPKLKRRKAVAYARVSSLPQSVDSMTLEGQFDAIKAYAKANRMEIVNYEMDEASAHGSGSENRPGLQSAIRHARASNAVIVVVRVDRLSRWLPSLEKLLGSGVRFYSTDHGYLSRKALRDGVAKAQEESDQKSRAQKDLGEQRRARGKKRSCTLRPEDRRTGRINNMLRRDDNVRAVAQHFCRFPSLQQLTWQQRAECLSSAGITRQKNLRTEKRAPWTKEALRKVWPKVAAEIDLMQDVDPVPGKG